MGTEDPPDEEEESDGYESDEGETDDGWKAPGRGQANRRRRRVGSGFIPMSVICGLLSASVLIDIPASAGSPGETMSGPVAATPRVTRILVRPGAPGGEGLLEDLRLRLPETVIGVQPASEPSEGLTVFVALRDLAEGDGWALELVTSDGRGFDRALQMEGEWSRSERRRFAAANIAQLIEGVEAGTLPPDREAVALPQVCEARTTPGTPEAILLPPGNVVVQCPDPPPEAPTPVLARGWRFGVRVAPAAVLGLGEPDDRSGFAGGGVMLGVVARAQSGVLVLTEVRGLRAFSPTLDASLGRARISLGSGAVLRAGDGGELEIQGAVSVEPWWLRRGGESVTLPGRGPALGAWARVVAGSVWRWRASSLRVGGWTELAVSGVVGGDGIRVAGVSLETDAGGQTTRTPAFRVGGVEISAGLELQVAFALGAR